MSINYFLEIILGKKKVLGFVVSMLSILIYRELFGFYRIFRVLKILIYVVIGRRYVLKSGVEVTFRDGKR